MSKKEVPEEKVKQCQLLFDLMDSDKDSCVSVKQIEEMCKALGAAVDGEELNEFSSEYSEGKVNFDQFFKFFSAQFTRTINQKKLLSAFEFIDKGKTGTLSAQELKHAVMVLGEPLTEKEADDLLKPYISGGKVDYKKLVKEITK